MGEPHPEDARLELGYELGRCFDRQPRLAGTAGAGERDEAPALSEQRHDFLCLARPADKRAGGSREVRVGDRLQRREGPVAELEDGNRLGDVLEPVLAEVDERAVDKLGGRTGEDDLASVAYSGDAGGKVHIAADVALLRDERRARVQSDSHLDRPRREPLGHRLGSGERSRRCGKGEEERVSLGVDLYPSLGSAGRADHATMLGQSISVRIVAELVTTASALDVGEQERDRAGRESRSHSGMMLRGDNGYYAAPVRRTLGLKGCGSALLLLIAVAAVAAMPAAGRVGQLTPVKIAMLPVEPVGQSLYAKHRGMFRKQGVDAKLTILADPSQIAAALLSGDAQFMATHVGSAASLKSRGAPRKGSWLRERLTTLRRLTLRSSPLAERRSPVRATSSARRSPSTFLTRSRTSESSSGSRRAASMGTT